MERTNRWNCEKSGLVVIVTVALISLLPSVSSALKINKYGGYEDLMLSVEKDVPPIICQQLLQNVGDMFTAASDYFQEATNGLAYFHRIVIVIPSTWDTRACGTQVKVQHTSASATADAAVEIRGDHPVFGSAPFTQQSQGCGKPGDRISVSYRFFLPNNDSVNSGNSPLSYRKLVHEWTKYRYGVFEEVGFANDSVYPLGYRRDSNAEIEPNYCTNEKLNGSWSENCVDTTGVNCAFNPLLSDNENVTSSLMSVPNLPHVKAFCDSSNHNREAPSKHNFLCGGRSVSEVMLDHPDFLNRHATRQARRITPEIVVKQIVRPRYVLLIEETANMNLRDVWKYLKLAVRKFIKYDLEERTQVGIITMGTDSVRTYANMTALDGSLRGTLAEKLPNYPSVENSGGLSLRSGISQSVNMLKWNGARVAGSVIILISQGTIFKHDLEGIVDFLKKEEVSVATIEYPSSGDGKVATLSRETRGPYYSVRETGVGTTSHMSTYIMLINALNDIQRYYSVPSSSETPVLIHQEEFSGDRPSFVESSFSFDGGSNSIGQFYVYVPNPIDPKVNRIELMSPSGRKYTDQLSLLHDINVIKIDASIDQPGVWHYRIERLGDSHQSHFVQVVTTTTGSNSQEDLSVRIFSNADGDTRLSDYSKEPLILYVEVRRGASPVLNAEVDATVVAGTSSWPVKLLDNGNGDPDLTGNDGVYSRYILPQTTTGSGILEITVKVSTSPYRSKYIGLDSLSNLSTDEPCCGSMMISGESTILKTMSYNERLVTSYFVKIVNPRASHGYPPARIGDLRIASISERNVTFQFTCPGDDYDQGKVQTFDFYISKSRDGTPYVLDKILASETNLPGSHASVNFTLPSSNIFFGTVKSTDPYGLSSLFSNIVEVNLRSGKEEGLGGSGGLLSQQSNAKASMKLSKSEIALTVVGVLAFFVLVIGLIILCICCRRRASAKKEVTEGETRVFTISEVKEPIHWSASELLQEHEKRLSMYGQTTSRTDNQNNSQVPKNPLQATSSNISQQGTRYYSPTSSTRSYRSFADGQYRNSVDGGGRRPTFTDYESCSSDPIIKGPADYDTAVDSDTDNVHYRTIDSYVGAMYRANLSANLNPAFSDSNTASGRVSVREGERFQEQVQYNSYNFQGSSTSVNSKRRNITMV